MIWGVFIPFLSKEESVLGSSGKLMVAAATAPSAALTVGALPWTL